jgi:hypothetical protein
MIILYIFIVLCLVEFGVAYYYWSRVSDFYEVGKEVGGHVVKATPMKYKRLPLRFVAWLKPFKAFMWIPVGILSLINWLVAFVVGGLIELILLLF